MTPPTVALHYITPEQLAAAERVLSYSAARRMAREDPDAQVVTGPREDLANISADPPSARPLAE
jgi:hypothetical protein